MENRMSLKQLVYVLARKSYHNILDFNVSWMEYKGRFFVYFLVSNDEIIYVGRTRSLYERIVCHKQSYEFDKFQLIEYNTYEESLIEERDWIKYHQPRFNIRSKK